jgi:hypothetical protein
MTSSQACLSAYRIGVFDAGEVDGIVIKRFKAEGFKLDNKDIPAVSQKQ